MIAGLSSGISTAIRTASEARVRMDRATREIATGQRVSSVKDDGAAWARGAAIKSSIAARDVLADIGQRYKQVLEVTLAATETGAEQMATMSQLALAGAAARNSGNLDAALAITADYHQQRQALVSVLANATIDGLNITDGGPLSVPANYVGPGPYGTMGKWRAMPGNELFGGVTFSSDSLNWFSGDAWSAVVPGDLANVNFATFASNRIAGVVTGTQLNRDVFATHAHVRGTEIQIMDRLLSFNAHQQATEQSGLGSLLDADIAKSSEVRAQAEARQELALQTVRRALSAYSSYASGLLSNAQQTQRAIG